MRDEYRQEALSILGPLGSLELFAVFEGVKDVMRITCLGEKAQRLYALASNLGLFFKQSRYIIVDGISYCGMSHSISCVAQEPKDDNRRNVYIGVDEMVTELASMFDMMDHRRFGHVMGYPGCCVDFFCRNYIPENPDPTFAICEPDNGEYKALINRACLTFGYRLISHFPCRWDCEDSCRIAERMLEVLAIYNPEFARETVNCLESDVLYSPQMIVAIKNAAWDESTLILEESDCQIAGDLTVDAVRFEQSTVLALYKGKIVTQLTPVSWLPFQSQQRVVSQV